MAVGTEQKGTKRDGLKIAFNVPKETLDIVTIVAANEGISRSDVARRALIRDLASRNPR